MEGKVSVFYETKEAVSLTSYFEDFKSPVDESKISKVEQWRRAYFELLSWKNTWGIPYKMDIDSTSDHEPYLTMLIPPKKTDKVIEALTELGYGEVRRYLVTIAMVESPWEEKFDDVYDWFFE